MYATLAGLMLGVEMAGRSSLVEIRNTMINTQPHFHAAMAR